MPLILTLALALTALPCPPNPPVEGPVIDGYAPRGAYAGHWGIDLAIREGSDVAAVYAGQVTFVGLVAGNHTVTVNHGGGVRTSYSYLSSSTVAHGERVAAGTVLGSTGLAHGFAALHFSVRIGDRYVDPAVLLACRAGPSAGLRLLSRMKRPPAAYPGGRAQGHPRRDLRSSPSRSPRSR